MQSSLLQEDKNVNSKIKMKRIFLGGGEILVLPGTVFSCEKLVLLFSVGDDDRFKCVFCMQGNTPGYSEE